jgi:hypothetical protein
VSEITQFCKDVVIQGKSPVPREKIMQLEEAIKRSPGQIDLQTNHHFSPGIYVRELLIPADTILTGKIHRHELMNILVSGTIRVTTDDGVIELTGPKIYNSPPGMKKAAYAVTDVIWLNIHPTEETDLLKIEEQFIAPSFEALECNTEVLEKLS